MSRVSHNRNKMIEDLDLLKEIQRNNTKEHEVE